MSRIFQKSDFFNQAMNELKNYPALSARVAVGDVTITQHIGAISQMLAMLSMQIGLGQAETWIKARDNMVLADASAKGILPFAKAPIYRVNIKNNKDRDFHIEQGRRLLDSKGRVWIIREAVEIGENQTVQAAIQQIETVQVVHTVSAVQSFYSIPIKKPDNGQYLHSVTVSNKDGLLFEQVTDFNNVALNDKVYHILSDEKMDLSIIFGLQDRIGYTPILGEQFNITMRYTSADIVLPSASSLTFEYIQEDEEYLTILSDERLQKGVNPLSIKEMRKLCDYPSMYNENAVYLGEFSFLLQKKLNPFVFLNVWNEQIEEKIRGANQDNINCLFVSFIKDDMEKNEAIKQIKEIIAQADDSYRVKVVEPIEKALKITVWLNLNTLHDEALVKEKIKKMLLTAYGRESNWSKNINQKINRQHTVKMLRESIVELQDGYSDISINVSNDDVSKPEFFRYLAENGIVFER